MTYPSKIKDQVETFFEEFSLKQRDIGRVMSSLEKGEMDKVRARKKLYLYFSNIGELCHNIEEELRKKH